MLVDRMKTTKKNSEYIYFLFHSAIDAMWLLNNNTGHCTTAHEQTASHAYPNITPLTRYSSIGHRIKQT